MSSFCLCVIRMGLWCVDFCDLEQLCDIRLILPKFLHSITRYVFYCQNYPKAYATQGRHSMGKWVWCCSFGRIVTAGTSPLQGTKWSKSKILFFIVCRPFELAASFQTSASQNRYFTLCAIIVSIYRQFKLPVRCGFLGIDLCCSRVSNEPSCIQVGPLYYCIDYQR
jgi:hypothetical protein